MRRRLLWALMLGAGGAACGPLVLWAVLALNDLMADLLGLSALGHLTPAEIAGLGAGGYGLLVGAVMTRGRRL